MPLIFSTNCAKSIPKVSEFNLDGCQWYGVDMETEDIANNFEKFVWEPALVKINAISSATEAACLILSVDETVKNKQDEVNDQGQLARGRGGRGR